MAKQATPFGLLGAGLELLKHPERNGQLADAADHDPAIANDLKLARNARDLCKNLGTLATGIGAFSVVSEVVGENPDLAAFSGWVSALFTLTMIGSGVIQMSHVTRALNGMLGPEASSTPPSRG